MGNAATNCCGTYGAIDDIYNIDEMSACFELAHLIKNRKFDWRNIK